MRPDCVPPRPTPSGPASDAGPSPSSAAAVSPTAAVSSMAIGGEPQLRFAATPVAAAPAAITWDAEADALGRGRFVIRLLILLAFLVIVLSADAQRLDVGGGSGSGVSLLGPPPNVQPRGRATVACPSLAAFGNEVADLVDAVRPTVVHIRAFRVDGKGNATHEETGSGVLMPDQPAGRTVVVTNRHVVAGASLNRIEVHLEDGRQLTPVEKAEDAATDLAVLRLTQSGLPTARWADSAGLRVGHVVLACGSPFGISESFTLGIVSGLGRRALDLNDGGSVINQDFIQTDAAINPGNSGGPLVGTDGRIVGINTAIASRSGGNDGIGFSIPSDLARYITGQLLRYGRVRRGFLGVVLDEAFDLAAATRLRLGRVIGAHVTEVQPSSPAYRGGLRTDDVVIRFGGQTVEDERHLIHLVSLTPPNERVEVIVVRGGRRMTLGVTLQERTRTAEVPAPRTAPRLSIAPGDTQGISSNRRVW